VRVAGSIALARGDVAWLSWAPGAQHLFDRDGTRRTESFDDEPATLLA
jgi:hypothetical protein